MDHTQYDRPLATASENEQVPTDAYVGPKEYASMKGVHVETVKRWCRKGLIRCERVGRLGHWRIAL